MVLVPSSPNLDGWSMPAEEKRKAIWYVVFSCIPSFHLGRVPYVYHARSRTSGRSFSVKPELWLQGEKDSRM